MTGLQQRGLGMAFHCLIASTAMASMATWMIRIAASWAAVQHTGSAAAFASMLAAAALTEVYAKPLLSPLADYFDRVKVFQACVGLFLVISIAAAIVAAALPFYLWTYTAVLVGMAVVAALREPSAGALVPSLVEPSQIVRAQSIRTTWSISSQLLGSMLGGVLVAAWGTALSFAAAMVIVGMSLGVSRAVRPTREDGPTESSKHASAGVSWKAYGSTWHTRTIDGLRAVWQTRAERLNALAATLMNSAIFTYTAVILPLWVSGREGGTAAQLAALEVALGAGVVAGGVLATKRANAVLGKFRAMTLGPIAMSLGIAPTAFTDNAIMVGGCMLITGAGVALFMVNSSAMRAAATPNTYRARMVGGAAFLGTAAYPFATQALGVMIDKAGLAATIMACGVCTASAAIVLAANRDARAVLEKPDSELMGAYKQMYPAAFDEEDRRTHV